MVGIPLVSFLVSVVLVVFIFRKKVVWKRGKNSLTISYGDLLELGFNAKNKGKKIIVIPVNDTFDTVVEETSETIDTPLVSQNTLHGKWILKICRQNGENADRLNERIQHSLKQHGMASEEIRHNRGNKQRYKIGSVAVIDGENDTQFYLLAITSFDERNNAKTTKKQLRDAVDSLLDFYSSRGQGEPIYLPLIGTGHSRTGTSCRESLDIIRSSILTCEEKIVGPINIVIYPEDKDKVSIFD